MSKFLISAVETYAVSTDEEAKKLIEDAKHSTMFELKKYGSEFKEIKQKGEVVDEYYKVSLHKIFNAEKEPSQHIKVEYNVDYDIGE